MDTQKYIARIKKENPELKWQKANVITKGWDFVVVILDNKITFRFPRKQKDKLSLKREIQLLQYLNKQTRAAVPDYKYIARNKSFAGYPFVRGKELKKWRYNNLTIKQKNILAEQIALFLSSLHKTPLSIMKASSIRQSDPHESFKHLVKVVTKHVFPKLTRKEINLIKNYFLILNQSADDNFRPVIVHGDFGSDHVLWDANKNNIGVIDFADLHIGDPAKDFSRLYNFGPKFVNNVYQRYQGPKDQTFLQRAHLNFKAIALRVMVGGLTGAPISYQAGYKIFKQRFK